MEVLGAGPSRLFSREEANELIPSLQLSFATITQVRIGVEDLLSNLAEGDPTRVAGILRGEEPAPAGEEREVEELQRLILDLGQAVEAVVAHGVIIQELDPAAVDFPSVVEGRLVLLSWQYGERSVEYFHEVEEGFEAREPLPDARPMMQ